MFRNWWYLISGWKMNLWLGWMVRYGIGGYRGGVVGYWNG